ncbi:TetR/AcrR family transcriptional regulator [Pelagicoccus sp. SDUM812005]|uniref:TetR/AcrR family transcriptional regulator n=1 Tax=Pelagicoccus sp. SDUM812005 TaxID=3041257 RepID=UPI00280DE098|nr:TetR/AcrR family transcriptional regulator [Pelagicoccus sp. SDUM812005]MDQ8182122.1 TetR/AcrR family transcriptional regulator [Pelagicoccus sp. SDUM812005]
MSSTSAARSRKSPKRDLLLETAFRLFYLSGYHAVGIDTILAEAGVAKMTLYNHFKSKDELIVAALQRRADEILSAREATLSAASDDPLDQLSALFDAYEGWFKTPDFNGCAFIRAIAEYPDQASPVNQAVRQQKQILIDQLESLARKLPTDDPKSLATQIYLLAEGAIIRAHTFRDPAAAQLAKEGALALAKAARRP